MKKLIAMTLTMGLCAAGALVQAQTAGTGAAETKAIEKIESDWVAAVKAKNSAKLGEILADSWVGLGWDGKITDKSTNLAELKASGNALESFEMGPIRVRLFGNTAVVTGSNTEKSSEAGKDTSGKYIWTDVFVKQNGKWRAVSSQSTKMPK